MKIGMVLEERYPTDIRVAKEVQRLTDAGHEVFVLSNEIDGRPAREVVDDAVVIRRPLGNDGSIDGYVRQFRRRATNVDRQWMAAIRTLVDGEDIDVLHAHDLPLVETTLEVGEERGIPVVADLHENWPEAVRQYRATRTWRSVRDPRESAIRLLQPIRRWKRIERDCVQRADRVIAVVEEGREHYIADCGADPDRTFVVSNVVQLEKFDVATVDPVGFADDDFVVSYVGTLGGRHRGLHTVVEAMPAVVERAPETRLLIVGGGEPYGGHLRQLAEDLGVDDRVTFTGQVPFEEVPSYIAASDACLVPHVSSGHTESTVPHKLFQYMAMRKPVIVTEVGPLARIVRETESGVVVPPEEPTAMARAVINLCADPERVRTLGERGRDAVETRYNWSRESDRLLACYEGLGPAADGGRPQERGVESAPPT